MKRTSRKSSNLSGSLQRQLNTYALAASAAGVGALALAQPAEAKIIYTPVHVVIGHGGVQEYDLHLAHSRAIDFKFIQATSCDAGCSYFFDEFDQNAAGAMLSSYGGVVPLKRGAQIGPSDRFFLLDEVSS